MIVEYKNAEVSLSDSANTEVVGRSNYKTIQLALFQLEEFANWACNRYLRKEAYPLAQGQFKANRSVFRLEPGDRFIFQYSPWGIMGMVLLVTKVEETGPDSEILTVSFQEDIDSVGTIAEVSSGGQVGLTTTSTTTTTTTAPVASPSQSPSTSPTRSPSKSPSKSPSESPSVSPSE